MNHWLKVIKACPLLLGEEYILYRWRITLVYQCNLIEGSCIRCWHYFLMLSYDMLSAIKMENLFFFLQGIYERYDRDRSGKIDLLELRDALYGIGLATPSSVLQVLISKYDDGSGRKIELNFDSFVEWVSHVDALVCIFLSLLLGLLIWLNLLLCCIWLAGAGWFWRWDHNPTNLNLLHSSFYSFLVFTDMSLWICCDFRDWLKNSRRRIRVIPAQHRLITTNSCPSSFHFLYHMNDHQDFHCIPLDCDRSCIHSSIHLFFCGISLAKILVHWEVPSV